MWGRPARSSLIGDARAARPYLEIEPGSWAGPVQLHGLACYCEIFVPSRCAHGILAPMRNPIIVALDVSGVEAALALVEQLVPVVGGFKIGSELFTLGGPEVVRRIRALDAKVFLDLKFHDIPNTVARAVAAAVTLDVQMLTVHASGGLEMLRAAEQSAQENARKLSQSSPLVLGVTVLTSLDSNELSEIGCEANVAHQVERLATLVVKAGLGGLVCSPLEIAALRQIVPSSLQLVTPGIRAADDQKDDQKRTLSPAEALAAGANWLVIGRPVCAAGDPRRAAEEILASLP
jgi:orotidine-5'-phosphate decarboxylase